MTNISSRSNPRIKHIRALLQQRKTRRATGLFVVEGIRHVGEAIESGARLEYLCYAPELLTSEFAPAHPTATARGLPCLSVSSRYICRPG